jgi:iron complex transport system ATP-binding protein
MRLEARNLTAGYGDQFRIEGVDLVIEERQITGVVGPNGAGKSTLLKALSRSLKPERGVVLLDGEVLHRLPGRDVARKLAFLGQHLDGVPDLTVEELVYRGRFPHQSLLRRDARADREAVEWALTAMRLEELRARHIKRLSHGELRRAWTGMALAQRPDVLLLDEPTAFLDIAHQFELLDLLSDLTHHGVTIVMCIHDLWMASIYCQRVIAMQSGRIVGSGPTSEVLTAELIREVFGVEVEVRDDPSTKRKFPLAYGRVRRRKAPPPDAASGESASQPDDLCLPDTGGRPSPH